MAELAGSWPFCPNCGTIFELPEGDTLQCDGCNFSCRYQDFGELETVTHSPAMPPPHWITGESEATDAQSKHAIVEEPCPKCGHPEMYFYTMQLRSADEGSTVFYECPKCSHKFSQNN